MGLSGMVKILREYDASPNAFVDNQNTAFMTAAEYNNWQIIEILLNAGADVTLRNSGGRTAIDYAKGCEKCLEILRRK